jgi:TolB-like protein
MRGRAPLAAALVFALEPAVSPAQRIAPLPLPCHMPGVDAARTIYSRIPQSLAVSAFQSDSTDAAGEYANGVADAIAARIGTAVPRVFVIGRRAQRRLTVTDSNTARAMSDSLGAAYVLAGRLSQGIRGRTISLTLYNGATGRALMNRTLSHDSSRVSYVEQTIAQQVALQIVGKLRPAEIHALERVPTTNSKAYDWFTRGTAARDVWAFTRAAQDFREATRLDRSYTAAFAELALADAQLIEDGANETVAANLALEMRGAANHALTLDSTSSLSWRADAMTKLTQGRPVAVWRRSYERAMALDPRDPAPIEELGVALVRVGDTEAGRPYLERALAMEPGRAQPIAALASLAATDHRDASACTLLNQAIVGDVLFAPAWAQRAVVRARHGDLRYAWADAETATQLGQGHLGESAGAIVDLIARDTSRARDRLTNEWTQVKAAGTIGIMDGTAIARALVAAGQVPRALDVLELARPRGPWLVAALRDPAFDTIRGDKRFRALTTKQ